MKTLQNMNLILERLNILKKETRLHFGMYFNLLLESEDGSIRVIPYLNNPDRFKFIVEAGEYEDEHSLFSENIDWKDIESKDIENKEYNKYEIFSHLLNSFTPDYTDIRSKYIQLNDNKILIRKDFFISKSGNETHDRIDCKYFDIETRKEEKFSIFEHPYLFSHDFLGVNSNINKTIPKVGDKLFYDGEISVISEISDGIGSDRCFFRLKDVYHEASLRPELLFKYKDVFFDDIRALDSYFKNRK